MLRRPMRRAWKLGTGMRYFLLYRAIVLRERRIIQNTSLTKLKLRKHLPKKQNKTRPNYNAETNTSDVEKFKNRRS